MSTDALPRWMERARTAEVDPARVEAIRAAVATAWPRHTVSFQVVRNADATATAVLTMHDGATLVLTTTVHGYDADEALRTIEAWAQVDG